MPGRRRVGLWDAHTAARKAKQDALTPEQKAAARAKKKQMLLVPVPGAPTVGDPEAVDWSCNCGYEPKLGPNGKVLPQTQEPAWQWTEEAGTGRKPSMRRHIADLCLKVYPVGYRHNAIELHNEGGFPDDLYWGPSGPLFLVRELKAMRHEWQRGQKQHLLSLRQAGLNVAVYYPCCILSGHVDEELASLCGRKPCGPYARTRHGQANPGNLSWTEIADGALNVDD
jgi:hypothetical protein